MEGNMAGRQQLLDISTDANVTFREAAEAFISARESEWRNRKHVQQWGNALKRYAYPVVGGVRARDIDTAMIVRILQPIWTKKVETVMGHRTGSNPARYVDHLQLVLPQVKKRSQVKHHAALPWGRTAGVRPRAGATPPACCTGIASAHPHSNPHEPTRTNEVRFARPEEFDLDNRIWSIPGDRCWKLPVKVEAVEIHLRQAENFVGDGHQIGRACMTPDYQGRRNSPLALEIVSSGI
jgi:integrase